MKLKSTINILSAIMIGFSALAIISVSLMAFTNPQSVMDLVQVQLNNNDAYSSIRGVYGGAGLTFAVIFIHLLLKNRKQGLQVLTIFWGSYAFSRLLTSLIEGPLGSFGTQWLIIESTLCLMCLILLLVYKLAEKAQ